jgi:S1-C subfamily serine protease
MYQKKHIYMSGKWRHKLYTLCLLGMLSLALACTAGLVGKAPAVYADSEPGGNVSDPSVRAVDIAEPAVVRIISQLVGQLTVTFSTGKSVTFPLTPQDGQNGYVWDISGTGAFISAHGDILTADHVVNPPTSDTDPELDQLAAQDVADYINQNLKPAQPETADSVYQELISQQLQSTTQYQKPLSVVFLDTSFSGTLTATSLQNVPSSQEANVDQIKQQSTTDQKDVAIIHVSGMDNMPMLQLGDSSNVQQQDNLTIIGFPGNGDVSDTNPTDLLTSSINQIYVSAIKTNNGAPVIQVGGNVEHGDSGGPALDKNGDVVGIVSFGLSDPNDPGQTTFLQASNSARQLVQAGNINTTPSTFQQAWSKAFNDYAATIPGHWHLATQEFQQLATLYPQFKALNQYLQYATEQAKTETQTQESGSSNAGSGASGTSSGLSAISNSTLIIGGGVVLLLLILIVGGVAAGRRRKSAVASVPANGYAPPIQSNGPGMPGQTYGNSYAQPPQGQSYGNSFARPPVSPVAPQPPAYQQPLNSGSQPVGPTPNAGYRPQNAPQPQQGQSFPGAGGLSPFGAPPVPSTPPPTYGTSTGFAQTSAPSVPEWRTWPCGHTNRADARFCGICGETAPRPPLVRRVEQ